MIRINKKSESQAKTAKLKKKYVSFIHNLILKINFFFVSFRKVTAQRYEHKASETLRSAQNVCLTFIVYAADKMSFKSPRGRLAQSYFGPSQHRSISAVYCQGFCRPLLLLSMTEYEYNSKGLTNVVRTQPQINKRTANKPHFILFLFIYLQI